MQIYIGYVTSLTSIELELKYELDHIIIQITNFRRLLDTKETNFYSNNQFLTYFNKVFKL